MFSTAMRHALGLTLAALLVFATFGSAAADPAPTSGIVPNHVRVPVVASGVDSGTHVAPSPTPRGAQSATINVAYDAGFQANPAAQAAFQAAVNIWASQLTSTVPITVDAHFSALPTGVLGEAGYNYSWRNNARFPRQNTGYPAPLAAALAGRDLDPTQTMITANFSNVRSDWYFGTDGNTPSRKIDFESVVLHELGHGLGFAGTGDVTGGIAAIDSPPEAFDLGVVDGTGLSVLNVNPLAMLTFFTSNNLYWTGTNTLANNGGVRAKLYAPISWQSGSSYSHLDETTYPAGNPNSLMTPSIGSAESVHDPGPIVRGVFQDMGWTINAPVTNNPLPAPGAYRLLVPLGSRGSGT